MPVEIFISYAHEDRDLCDQLCKQLSPLKRQERVRIWTDELISAGAEWSDEILAALDRAQLVLLLVSADFLASDFCYMEEMTRALERHRAGTARVVPVILRPCEWHSTPLGELKALPRDGKPVQEWPNPDAAFSDVVKGLGPVLKELSSVPDPEIDSGTATAAAEDPRPPGTAVRRTSPGGPNYKLILKVLREGKVILFLGRGAALSERDTEWTPESDDLPRVDELAQHLVASSNVASEQAASAGALQWVSLPWVSLPWVSQCFEGEMKRPTLDDELHEIYTRAERPGRLHRLLARFSGLVIVTLGWDRLLEAALNDARQPYHRVLYRLGESNVLVWRSGYSKPREEAPNEVDLDLDHGDIPVVFQLYGVAERDESERARLIVTERDYAELVQRLPEALPACFGRHFKKRHHLVLGCDLDAWSERVVLDQLWQKWKPERAVWAVHGPLLPLERGHWGRGQSLTVFELPLDDFVTELEREADLG